jgi:hypothetical protein
MSQFSKHACLVVEATNRVCVMLGQYLDRHGFAGGSIMRSKYGSHRTLAGEFTDLEAIADDLSLEHGATG